MPLSSEVVPNKALSGSELAQLMLHDLAQVLERDGMFTHYVAYGRVAYKVRIEIQMDNPTFPRHEVQTRARAKVGTPLEGEPPLAQPTSEDALDMILERDRVVDSPNAARVESGQPITVQIVQEGKLRTKEVRFDPDDVPEPQVVDRDLSPKTKG